MLNHQFLDKAWKTCSSSSLQYHGTRRRNLGLWTCFLFGCPNRAFFTTEHPSAWAVYPVTPIHDPVFLIEQRVSRDGARLRNGNVSSSHLVEQLYLVISQLFQRGVGSSVNRYLYKAD